MRSFPSVLHLKYSFFPAIVVSCNHLIFFAFLLQEVKVFTYENSAKHKTEKDAIAEVETRGCYAQQKQAYTVNIQVPPTSPTDVTTSKIVHVKYYLKVSHNLSHFTFSLCCVLVFCACSHVCLFIWWYVRFSVLFNFFYVDTFISINFTCNFN